MHQDKNTNIVCVDFDDTLMDTENVAPGHKMGYPEPDAVEAINYLHKKYYIVVLTARRPAERNILAQWLKYFNIPFDDITDKKPVAICYIDNRGLRYQKNWPQIVEIVDKLAQNPNLVV